MIPVVIAGCSRGLGKDLFEHYDKIGYTIFGCARQPRGEDTRQVSVDLTSFSQTQDFFRYIDKSTERFRLIVVAGVNAGTQPFAIESKEVITRNLESNFMAPLNAIKVAQKYAFTKSCVSVVYLSSLAVSKNINGSAVYAGCKAGIEKLMQICASESTLTGCSFNTLRLGYYKTNSTDSFSDLWLKTILENQFVKRSLTTQEIACAIDFLSSSVLGGVMTGQTIKLCHV